MGKRCITLLLGSFATLMTSCTKGDYDYKFIAVFVALLILIITGFVISSKERNKKDIDLNNPTPQSTLVDTVKDQPKIVEEKPLSLQNFFSINFEDIPDESFSFQADINSLKSPIVVATKRLAHIEFDLFSSLELIIFKDGSVNVQFLSEIYNFALYDAFVKVLKTLYIIYGQDDRGLAKPSDLTLHRLRQFNHLYDSFSWQNHKIELSINNFAILRFTHVPIDRDRLINSFFKPNVVFTKHGILSHREAVLVNTEASILTDDFTKRSSIYLTKVAGIEHERNVYTYTLTNNTSASLQTLTRVGLTFSYSGKYFFLHVSSNSKSFQLAKGDNIIFLFEDDSTITANFDLSKIAGDSGLFRNICNLTYQEVRTFATKKLLKWKMTSSRKGLYDVGGLINNIYVSQYKGEEEGQFLLQLICKKLIQCVIIHEGNYFNETDTELLN